MKKLRRDGVQLVSFTMSERMHEAKTMAWKTPAQRGTMTGGRLTHDSSLPGRWVRVKRTTFVISCL